MNNKTLKQIFHMAENQYLSIYNLHVSAPSTIEVNIETRANTRQETFPMFISITPEMMILAEEIHAV